MEKVILLFIITLSSFSLTVAILLDDPSDYLHSFPDDVQERLFHCSSLPPDEKPLCQLEAAIDAQGYPATTAANTVPPSQPPPPSNMSCQFRDENIYSLYPYAMDPSPQFKRLLEKYFAMHIRCKDLEYENLGQIYMNLKRSSCRYLIWRPSENSFGNQILTLVSSFLYAILSARVLLIDYPDWDKAFCEPFVGSTIHFPATANLTELVGHRYHEFLFNRCGAGGNGTKPGICNDTTLHFSADHTTPIREYESISCPTGYARIRNIPFLFVINGNQYFIPGLYVNPLLSPLLEVLFPQRNAFHILSRYLLTLNDVMWNSIRSKLDIHGARRIGVQIGDFRWYNSVYDTNIIRCIYKTGSLVPKGLRQRIQAGEYTAVYVAATDLQHVKGMNETMQAMAKKSGWRFKVKWQLVDGSDMKDSVLGMWVLSMSHVLITTGETTFGYVAAGLSGAAPYFLDRQQGESCSAANGLEPCFHAAPNDLLCVQEEPKAYSLEKMVLFNFTMIERCVDRKWSWTIA